VNGALRGLDHHPEKSDLGGEKMAELAGEKADLVTAIKSKDADKKIIGTRIAELNKEMAALLAPERLKLKEQLDALKQKANEWEVASARDYPCFLYTPDQILDLIK
jgi:predicted nuclease with TOPRIM domain